MKLRVVMLGADFGGLERSMMLSEAIGNDLDLALIDQDIRRISICPLIHANFR
jgi:sulfide:quinone oxidoreductase